ncbi:hypothetical protein M413DRAFT_446110 [Hebeloma cylindrosporum]|uniref:Uncharacterized protein n=1 Tax=Hebeloma cylindrosporum TaxID=76867 RepID=A0A0C3BVS2_HEBCY|nr:hypothetical protein M413DRAFT_446110 [Hebeloma cylindrosporum h7]
MQPRRKGQKRRCAKAGPSSKRKHNNDEGAGGLLIVRAPDPQISQSQPTTSHHVGSSIPPFASQPIPSGSSAFPKPAAKKFKADPQTQPRPRAKSKAATRDRVAYSTAYDDSEVEKDVRAMEDEADHLRRNSRAHTTIDSSLLVRESGVHFPPRPEPSNTSRSKGKTRIIDTSVEMPESETPKIERNRQMRKDAMDAYNNSLRTPEPNSKNQTHRRKSSVGRGKRTSTSFEATGVITQPHNSVSESSFYKHIDSDLPEPERIRQLLIWCSLRASSTSSSSSASSSKSNLSTPKVPLPPLSADGVQVLQTVQKAVIRMLAEKKIDLSLYSEANTTKLPEDLRENEQNVRNRLWEVMYSQHIQQYQAEEESWKKVSYGYDAYAKKLQSSLEKRAADLQLDPQAMSAKAKGKRRATGDITDSEINLIPQDHELPPEFHSAAALAKSILGHRTVGDDRIAGGGRRASTRLNLNREEMEAEIKHRLQSLEYKVDRIFTFTSAARTTTNVAEKALNERFDILTANLTSRINPFPQPAEEVGSGSTQLLSTYVNEPRAKSTAPDPMDLMRALSRVDQERPPTQVGDAARRAAREVQWADERGVAAVGDRRLTEVPATPKKTPATPRRGNTPSRDR